MALKHTLKVCVSWKNGRHSSSIQFYYSLTNEHAQRIDKPISNYLETLDWMGLTGSCSHIAGLGYLSSSRALTRAFKCLKLLLVRIFGAATPAGGYSETPVISISPPEARAQMLSISEKSRPLDA